MEPIENESQNLRNFVELADQEALAGVFVVHLAAELLDALGMTISLISGMFALDELDHLV